MISPRLENALILLIKLTALVLMHRIWGFNDAKVANLTKEILEIE